MNLRDFGQRNGLQVTPVSIGTMRLPRDVSEAVALLRYAIDRGMRYIDTSRGYGEAEFVLSRALKDGYRDKVILSTKWCPWLRKVNTSDDTSAECMLHRIKEQLLRLDVEYLDYYQLWNINSRKHFDQATAPGGMLDGIRQAQKEGLVKRTGFTTHDTVDNLLSYMDSIEWCDIILFSHNLLNHTYLPAIEAAHARGIGVLVMNPMGGGTLADESPKLSSIARDFGADSLADLAIRYVLSNPHIDTILCGMTKQADVDDTIASAEKPPFSVDQLAAIDARVQEISTEPVWFCPQCGYCMPCPKGINIPVIMNAVYEYRFLGRHEKARNMYAAIQEAKADSCIQCGQCEKKCTQHLNIMKEMKCAAETFGK